MATSAVARQWPSDPRRSGVPRGSCRSGRRTRLGPPGSRRYRWPSAVARPGRADPRVCDTAVGGSELPVRVSGLPPGVYAARRSTARCSTAWWFSTARRSPARRSPARRSPARRSPARRSDCPALDCLGARLPGARLPGARPPMPGHGRPTEVHLRQVQVVGFARECDPLRGVVTTHGQTGGGGGTRDRGGPCTVGPVRRRSDNGPRPARARPGGRRQGCGARRASSRSARDSCGGPS